MASRHFVKSAQYNLTPMALASRFTIFDFVAAEASPKAYRHCARASRLAASGSLNATGAIRCLPAYRGRAHDFSSMTIRPLRQPCARPPRPGDYYDTFTRDRLMSRAESANASMPRGTGDHHRWPFYLAARRLIPRKTDFISHYSLDYAALMPIPPGRRRARRRFTRAT